MDNRTFNVLNANKEPRPVKYHFFFVFVFCHMIIFKVADAMVDHREMATAAPIFIKYVANFSQLKTVQSEKTVNLSQYFLLTNYG